MVNIAARTMRNIAPRQARQLTESLTNFFVTADEDFGSLRSDYAFAFRTEDFSFRRLRNFDDAAAGELRGRICFARKLPTDGTEIRIKHPFQ